MSHTPIIGLAGSAGSGKSTVANEFAKLGCAVISADQLNRQILQEPQVADQLRQWWGDTILGANGYIDRTKVASVVFGDNRQLQRLEQFLHPLIAAKQQALIQQYQQDPAIKAIILDVPLLFEVGQDKLCDCVVFVRAHQDACRQRLLQRGWDMDRVKKTENLQLALDTKLKMSDHIIANDSDLNELSVQVAELLPQLLKH